MIHSLRLKVRAFWTVMSGALSGDSGSAKENQMNEPSSRAATTSFSDGNIQVESGVTKTNRLVKIGSRHLMQASCSTERRKSP